MTKPLEPWMEELLHGDSGARMTEKQARIFKAAIDVFAEKGYAASSTSEIAQRAGVAEGTIFRHYKTKKDLLLSIVTPAMVKLLAPFVVREIREVLDSDYESFDQFLRAMIDNRIAFLNQNRSLFKIIVQEIPFHPDLQEQLEHLIFSQVKGKLDAIVSKFKAEGKLIDLPSLTIIRLTAFSILGYVVLRDIVGRRDESKWDDELEREATINFIMKGLAP
ncbi:TetR family transcriptional regulator [Paenibacillus sp. 32O-W]|jgi:Transcriptional regulator|uniref:TetR family transcriptional regulator n=1 Tax=Paenibacillus cisolokensis TaxID=1658519 RepID=A0ABQ4N1Y0_9BACL|nr:MULTISPECIES: TetR/AcrR family transcriptional regulator [Paenibacillus]ALS26309.1 TetR family transcriptional regulator [Paenibacillus sp. 32O-W]GIQ62188.1 TetR family transcriptional regulator [Paenibacillus cisolokensis]